MFGVEAFRTKDVRATHKLVIDHLNSVRQTIPGMAEAQAVLCLESNLAFESQHILHALNLANVQKWVALSEGQAGTLGWLTTNERKEAMVFQLRDALKVGNIKLSTHFFSLKLGVNEALKVIRSELTNFAIVVEPPKTTFGKVCFAPPLAERPLLTFGSCNRCAKPTPAKSKGNKTTSRSRCSWRLQVSGAFTRARSMIASAPSFDRGGDGEKGRWRRGGVLRVHVESLFTATAPTPL